MPCVVYLHGNCGSRQDSLECVTVLLPHGITVFAFDFAGSGQSDGEYVSLGYFENQDLCSVIDYLHDKGTVSKIGLWGRSMGAVTSIMHASKDSSLGGIVCDSPFFNLRELMQGLVAGEKSWIPRWLVRTAIQQMRQTIIRKVEFDIEALNTVDYAKRCRVPALLGHAADDLLVPMEHSRVIRKAYLGDCTFIPLEGGHNSDRPDFFMDEVVNFFIEHLINRPAAAAADEKPAKNPVQVHQFHVDPHAGIQDPQESTHHIHSADSVPELDLNKLESHHVDEEAPFRNIELPPIRNPEDFPDASASSLPPPTDPADVAGNRSSAPIREKLKPDEGFDSNPPAANGSSDAAGATAPPAPELAT
ncbi:hypothetical protein DIPPA_12402 [Diplonema papillatum]|nr:hypothetical protein DIPPA_12402 [Diplonema papillatum]